MEREELIKIAEQLISNGCSEELKEALVKEYPELAKSEDERIRKAILGLSYLDGIEPILTKCSVTRSDIRSYLEKQKELFESGRGLYYYDGEKTTYCGYPATEENPNDFAISQREKQKEQKPVEWSEEDERKYQCIRNILLTDVDKKVGSWKYSEILEWYEKRGIGRYTNSQPHWKPSEEQMDSLRDTIVQTKGYSYSMYLPELYEQLKKLGVKEETEYHQHFDPDC